MYELIIVWNIFVFILYGVDKYKAKKKYLRIPESVLIIFAIMFGGIGAMFGMVVFNHKTSKIKFRILIPIITILNYLLFVTNINTIIANIFAIF